MATYTHNLKIILVDNNNDIIIDNEFLDEIKNALCKLNTIDIQWNNNDSIITNHVKNVILCIILSKIIILNFIFLVLHELN